MKNKLLLFFLLFSFLGKEISAKNFEITVDNTKIGLDLAKVVFLNDSIKKSKTSKIANSKAIIPSPLTTAGSSCKNASDSSVKVFVTASGGSGDVIEWFASPISNTILHTGSIFGPSISKTTTYYVQSHSGSDISVRVPVVASVYTTPAPVSLSVSPINGVCIGTEAVFTANGGADLFEFSVDGVVVQQMSTNRIFKSSTLTNGQTVSVRTRYAVNFDGSIIETAWGYGAMADNSLSSALSLGAADGYINSVNISSTEDKLVFGVAGKLGNNKSILLFLDTKPGGFNVSNYGDEAVSSLSVKAFNYFNNNPSTFDANFYADYCLAISSNDGGINYFADIIELKIGTSVKTNLGSAATGIPSSFFAVNKGNLGTQDYSLGFEVGVLKSLIGYVTGDIKFFAFTMGDESESNYTVTNSFLNPERTSTADYGNLAIDYNGKDPNPIVVSSDALIPCYAESSVVINIVEQPTTATVGSSQFNCMLTSGSLGGNTPTVGTGKWSLKSGSGSVTFSNIASGSSTATVDIEGIYVFTWTITNDNCVPSTADITVEFRNTSLIPTLSSVTQPTCSVATGSFTITNYSATYTYSVIPSTGVTISGNTVTAPTGSYTITAALGTCTSSAASITINAQPITPTQPTLSNAIQPTCSVATGSFTITNYDASYTYSANPSTGVTISGNMVTAPMGSYTITATSSACISVPSASKVINAQPITPTQPTLSSVTQPTCSVATGSFTITNYNVSYTYSVSPSTGITISGNTVTALTGSYAVTATLGGCTLSTNVIINPIPPQIQFEIVGDCQNKEHVLTANPLSNSYDPESVNYQWKDSSGSPVGTNSNSLNVSDLIASTTVEEIFPLNYSLAIQSATTACETISTFTIDVIYCNIQKGISPGSNGLNEYFDLKNMNVNKLEIFNRYGIKVYSQSNYTDQWKGQSSKGEELPSATYYYVMELNKGETKTGWIYLIREK